jgi:hypothetical protein
MDIWSETMIITILSLILLMGLHATPVNDPSCRERLKKNCQEGSVKSELICQLLSQGMKERGYSLFAFLNACKTIEDETLRENIVCARLMGYKEFRNVPVYIRANDDFLQGKFILTYEYETQAYEFFLDFNDPKLHKLIVKLRELNSLSKYPVDVFGLRRDSNGGSYFFMSFVGHVTEVTIGGRSSVNVEDVKVMDIYAISKESKELVYLLKNGNYSKMIGMLNDELEKAYE